MKTEITEQQIKKYAKAIGDRPYHPIGADDLNGLRNFRGLPGITIRQEFMRTAMGHLISNDWVSNLSLEQRRNINIQTCTDYTDALLYQLAKAELEAEQEVGNV
jgi:hypothetical protein